MVAQAVSAVSSSGVRVTRRHSQELHPDVVRYIEEELAQGRSHRAIALSTGVHRETVGKIAAGEHVIQLLRSRYQRCPEGHLTTLPCPTCAALQEQRRRLERKKRKVCAA